MAYSPWAFTQTSVKRRQWRNIARGLGADTPTAWVRELYRVVPFVRTDGQRWVVLLVNASMEATTPLHLEVHPAVRSAEIHTSGDRSQSLVVDGQDTEAVVTLPPMGPWSFQVLSMLA